MEATIHEAYKITWADNDPAAPALIEPMLDDIGIDSEKAREATAAFCRELLQGAWVTMGDMELAASHFEAGYEAGTTA